MDGERARRLIPLLQAKADDRATSPAERDALLVKIADLWDVVDDDDRMPAHTSAWIDADWIERTIDDALGEAFRRAAGGFTRSTS